VRFADDAANPLASRIDSNGHAPDGAGAGARDVELVTIDDWVERSGVDRVDYIKVDAEGSDLGVLRGAEATLRRWRPALAITTYHDPAHANEMVRFVEGLDLGYRMRVKGVVCFGTVARPVMLHASC
jgi:hypothetical protein